jgi:hypothetical protein
MSELTSFLIKLSKIPRGYLYILLILGIAYPTLNPIGLPIPVSTQTQKWYDYVENMSEGDVAVIFYDYTSAVYPIMEPAAVANLHHFVRKGVKCIGVTRIIEGEQMYEKMLPLAGLDSLGAKYGEDWVMLGFAAGGEIAAAAIAEDIRGTYTTDMYGTPIDDIPIMNGINNVEDFDLIVQYTNDAPIPLINQIVSRYGTPFLSQVLEAMVPGIMPFVQSGQITALMNGAKGAAEYEFLLDRPGSGVITTDAFTLTHLTIFVFLILGNIGYWVELRTHEEGG